MKKEQYSFKWNSIQSDVWDARQELFIGKKYADVTLVSDDLVKFPAHKTVLGSASPVFASLLELTTEQCPVMFLKGVSQIQLEAMLKFVYIGEASISKDQVQEFYKISSDLGIKGLLEEEIYEERHEDKPIEKLEFLSYGNTSVEPEKEASTHNSLSFLSESIVEDTNKFSLDLDSEELSDEAEETVSISTNENDISEHQMSEDLEIGSFEEGHNDAEVQTRVIEDTENEVFNTKKADLQVSVETKANSKTTIKRKKVEEPSECSICAKVFTTQRSMQRHHKVVHELVQVECKDCGKRYGSRDHLNVHVKRDHLKIRFPCDLCDKKCNDKTTLNHHKKRHHPPPNCDFCNIQFNDTVEFSEHVQKEHLEKYCK